MAMTSVDKSMKYVSTPKQNSPFYSFKCEYLKVLLLSPLYICMYVPLVYVGVSEEFPAQCGAGQPQEETGGLH